MMYGINDIYDYESDIVNPRKTDVLPKEKHSQLWAAILFTSLPFFIFVVLTQQVTVVLWFSFMVFMLFSYSMKGLRWKELPLLDSITSSFHYTSPAMLALLITGFAQEYLPAFVAYFLWAMGNHAFGAIQDIKPDTAGGIKSVATEIGALNTTIFVLFLYVSAAVLAAYFYQALGLLAASLIGVNILGTAFTLRYRLQSDHEIYRKMWKFFTNLNYFSGMVMTLGLLIAA